MAFVIQSIIKAKCRKCPIRLTYEYKTLYYRSTVIIIIIIIT